MLRAVAAFRLQRASWVDCPASHRWDVRQVALRLKRALEAFEPQPDLVLAGREFGDCDDGALPPHLAEVLGWRFVGLAQEISREEDALKFRRSRGNADEWLRVPVPVVASITNDKSNRLRHPLMKNMAAARRETFAAITLPAPDAAPRLAPGEFRLQEATRRQGASCRMIEGPVDRQVCDLAKYLTQWRVAK